MTHSLSPSLASIAALVLSSATSPAVAATETINGAGSSAAAPVYR